MCLDEAVSWSSSTSDSYDPPASSSHVIPDPRGVGGRLDEDILFRTECSEDWGFLEVRDTAAGNSSIGEWGNEQCFGECETKGSWRETCLLRHQKSMCIVYLSSGPESHHY